jgi:aspartate/methionine/tyrosine aminotransferase
VDALSTKQVLAMADDECRELWEDMPLTCTESKGLTVLRHEIIRQFYPQLDIENLNVLCPQEGIFVSMNALLGPGDHVVAVSPAYQSLTSVAQSIGCEVSLWRCREDEQDAALPLKFGVDDLERLLRPTTKLLVVNFPHNPTGFVPTLDEWATIIDLCKARGIILFSDEMFSGLERDPSRRLPPACTLYDKSVTLYGVSKVFGLAGARIGWLASQDKDFLARVSTIKDYISVTAPTPCELLALIVLRNKDLLLQRSLAVIDRGIQAVQAFMDAHSDVFVFHSPLAGPIAFVKVRNIPKVDTKAVMEYAEKLVKETGIVILPGEVFGDPAFNDRFRISVGRQNTSEIMEIWEKSFVAP